MLYMEYIKGCLYKIAFILEPPAQSPNANAVNMTDHEISIASVPLVAVRFTVPSSPMNRFSKSETNCMRLADGSVLLLLDTYLDTPARVVKQLETPLHVVDINR